MIFSEGTLKCAQPSRVNKKEEGILRLFGKHFIDEIPATDKKKFPPKRCRVCYKKKLRKEARFHCTVCPEQPGLHLGKCFNDYHTKAKYCELGWSEKNVFWKFKKV